MKVLDVFWSFRSPYSYLATPDILAIKRCYDLKINIRVVLPLAIRRPETLFSAENRPRLKYILLDWKRRAEYLGLPNAFPNPDPVVMDMINLTVSREQPLIYKLSMLGIESNRQECAPEFIAEVSKLIFGGTSDWHKGEHLSLAAKNAGLNLEEMEDAIGQKDSYLNELAANQQLLEESGHWGVPTFVVDKEPFFGQDRTNTLRWRLDQMGLKKK